MLIGFPYPSQRQVYTEAGHCQALVAIADWGGRAALIPRAAVEPAIASGRCANTVAAYEPNPGLQRQIPAAGFKFGGLIVATRVGDEGT